MAIDIENALTKGIDKEMARNIDQELANTIGIKLMRARNSAGLTREQLSERSGVEANSVYRFECGMQIPKFSTVIRLAMGLKVAVEDLVPDKYIVKTQNDPGGVLDLFYQMDKQDQREILRQMKALVMLKNVE